MTDPCTVYKCPECGWHGRVSEMDADEAWDGEGGEYWSNWICPQCHTWWWLEDYIVEREPDET